MKNILSILLSLILLLTGCGKADRIDADTTLPPESPAATGSQVAVPEAIQEIPDGYFEAAQEQGTLEDLYYDTWESFSYEEKTQPLQKHAVIYLPYGYDESQSYDVFYLMHGGWGNENQTLGTPESPSLFKNVIDNAIENGDFEPLIIVCPTYNNTSPEDSASFSLALRLNQNLHNELVNDLLPAVEGKYSTYAEGTSASALMAARDHRGFGGFSMGSVATWRTFENCMDYLYCREKALGLFPTRGDVRKNSMNFAKFMKFSLLFCCAHGPEGRTLAKQKVFFSTHMSPEKILNWGSPMACYLCYYLSMSCKTALNGENVPSSNLYTVDTPIRDVISDPVFGDYGRLIFPVDEGYWSGDTLGQLRLTWYNYIDPDKTVEICNYMKDRAAAGDVIFYDIYTEDEKAADPAKRDTGLFFFKGNPGGKIRRLQRRRGLCLCGGHARQLPPCIGAVQNGLQRLRPHLPARLGHGGGGFGPGRQLHLRPRR